jgi:hypothetical protein
MMRSKADLVREIIARGISAKSFNTLRKMSAHDLGMMIFAQNDADDPLPDMRVSILDAPSELSESEQEDHETPTDCVTPLPVYAPMALEAPKRPLGATISPWWDKWLKLVLRAFSPLKLMMGV